MTVGAVLGATPFLSSYHYALGPLAAVTAVLAALGASRWVFSTSHRQRRAAAERACRDFGLLVDVATPADTAAAEAQREFLAAAGVRATVAVAPAVRGPVHVTADGYVTPPPELPPTVHLLVFPADVERARDLLQH